MRKLLLPALILIAMPLVDKSSAQVGSPTPHADSIHFRNACRQAIQTVKTGEPKARYADAAAQLRFCGAEAQEILVGLWGTALRDRSLPDSVLGERAAALLGMTDGRLFDLSLAAATDRGLTSNQRTMAMVVVVAQLEPRLWFDAAELRNVSSGHYCAGPAIVSHVELVNGQPMPSDAAAKVVAAMATIIEQEGAMSNLGSAAGCVRRTARILVDRPTGT